MTGSSGTNTNENPGWYSVVGLTLACCSGSFVGLSLILQKKGLMITTAKSMELGRPLLYVMNPVWQMGIISMALGELSNFGAYAFSPAILGIIIIVIIKVKFALLLVTPLSATSVVVR